MTTVAARTVKPPGTRRRTCGCGCRQPWYVAPEGAVYDHDRASRAVRFFTRHLRHTKGVFAGRPFIPEPWQEWHLLRPVFGCLDPATGSRWFTDAVWSVPRKCGKSAVAAGVAAYLLVADGEHAPEVFSLAGSAPQARLVFREASLMMQGSPMLRHAGKFYRSVIEVPENAGLYRVISNRADLAHGLNPSGAVVDEYHVHRSGELRTAIQTGTGARAQPLTVTISTVPAARSGPMWELLRPHWAPTDLDRVDPHTYLWWVGLRDSDDVADPRAWRRANPASWITDTYLTRQWDKLAPAAFEQLHGNRIPAARAGSWLHSMAEWDACAATPAINPDRPCVIGVDAAPKRDLTAVVLAQLDQAGRVHARCWTFAADPDVGWLDFDLVEGLIRDLAREYWVARIVVDPFAMIRSMMTLAGEGLPIEDFPQCTPGDVNITLADGTPVRADSVCVGDEVMGAGNDVGTVLARRDFPPAPCLRVLLKSGRSLVTTLDHPFLIQGRDGRERWVKARHLKPGLRVVLSLGFAHNEPCDIDPEEAWCLGLMIGDGDLISGQLAARNDDIVARFGQSMPMSRVRLGQWHLPGARGWLRKHGVLGVRAWDKRVPSHILGSSATVQAAFLAGYLDADGTVRDPHTSRGQVGVRWVSVSRGLLEDCQHMLAGMGIPTKITRKLAAQGRWHEAWELYVGGRGTSARLWDLLGEQITCGHKRERLHRTAQMRDTYGRDRYLRKLMSDPVVAVEDAGDQATVGLTVSHGTHATNGVITHNTHARMTPASMGLRDAVVERRLVHGGDEALTAAARDAATQDTSFGWRLVKAHGQARIDPLIALAMAVRILDLDESLTGVTPTVMVV